MKKCISKAIINCYDYFLSNPFINGPLCVGGYELHFRDKVFDELRLLIAAGCCNGLPSTTVVAKEKQIPGVNSSNKTDIYCTHGTTEIIIEFGHYTTIQASPLNAVNKPISDIHKWLSRGSSNIYTVNVITHWLNNPPLGYRKSYLRTRTLPGRLRNLQFIEVKYYIIDPRLIKIVFRPTADVEMHIYVKGPFSRSDWANLKSDLKGLELNIFDKEL